MVKSKKEVVETGLSVIGINEGEIQKSLTMDLTKDDIIAYRVSVEEERLEAEKKNLEEQLKKQREDVAALSVELQKMAELVASNTYDPYVNRINEAFVALGIKSKYELKTSIKMSRKPSERGIEVAMNTSSYHNEDLKDIPFSDDMKKVADRMDLADEEVCKTINLMTEVRVMLSNMNRLERKAKAAFVAKMLDKNPQLKALLEANNRG
jgi:hypothetical protein